MTYVSEEEGKILMKTCLVKSMTINVTASQCLTALATMRQYCQTKDIDAKGKFVLLLMSVEFECLKEKL